MTNIQTAYKKMIQGTRKITIWYNFCSSGLTVFNTNSYKYVSNIYGIFLSSGGTSTVDLVCVCIYLFVLSFRSKFLVTKPLPRQNYYCACCLFMFWSGIPVAISVDSLTKEDDWLVSVIRTSSKLHRPKTSIQKLRTISGTFHNRVVSELYHMWSSRRYPERKSDSNVNPAFLRSN